METNMTPKICLFPIFFKVTLLDLCLSLSITKLRSKTDCYRHLYTQKYLVLFIKTNSPECYLLFILQFSQQNQGISSRFCNICFGNTTSECCWLDTSLSESLSCFSLVRPYLSVRGGRPALKDFPGTKRSLSSTVPQQLYYPAVKSSTKVT